MSGLERCGECGDWQYRGHECRTCSLREANLKAWIASYYRTKGLAR